VHKAAVPRLPDEMFDRLAVRICQRTSVTLSFRDKIP
jgi:hypothetical protein